MYRFVLFVLVLLLAVSGTVAAQEESYTVKPGDTITSIARDFDVEADAILLRNNLSDPNRIRSGQTLIIPTGVPATGGPSTVPGTYQVDIHDTLRSIGAKFGVTWQALAAYNNIANPNYIQAGMVLNIPPANYVPPTTQPATGGPVVNQPTTPVVTQPRTVTYIVQQGDVLELIAQRFNTTAAAIRQYNNITNSRAIFPGDVLVIPPTGGPVTQQPVTTPRQTSGGVYTVRSGDTLFAISASFGVNIYRIAEANGLLNLNAIFTGQRLVIPGR